MNNSRGEIQESQHGSNINSKKQEHQESARTTWWKTSEKKGNQKSKPKMGRGGEGYHPDLKNESIQ